MNIEQLRQALSNSNVRAFLTMLRHGEGTSAADGYRVKFGGDLFDSFSDHPRTVVTRTLGGQPISSSAAGAYQFLTRTWDGLVKQYGFTDFTPESQDLGAAALIAGRGALGDVIAGRFNEAVQKCNREWASLPGSPYGQPTVTLDKVRQLYVAAGGSFYEADEPIAAPPSPPTPISLPIPSPASKEKPVAPFVALAVSSIVNAVPDLIKIFGDKESAVAERNTKAAERVVEIAKETLGAANEQEVVERVESDPAAAEQVRTAVRSQWYELQAASAESIEAAAKRNEVYLAPGATPAYKTPAMQISLVVMFFVSMILVDMLFVHVDNYSPDMKAFVIGAIIGSGFSGVLAYFIGSSDGSKRAGDTVREIALKREP